MNEPSNRRRFLKSLGTMTAAGLAASVADAGEPMPLPDPARELRPSSADLGSLYADVERLAANRPYEFAFTGNRFRDIDEFKKAGRDKLFDLLLYRPEQTPFRAAVVDPVDCDTHIRAKILFNTSPHFRIRRMCDSAQPAWPSTGAILDLHSHGGMFLFGKEKGDRPRPQSRRDVGHYHRRIRRPPDGDGTGTARYVVILDRHVAVRRAPLLIMDADLKHGWDRARYS